MVAIGPILVATDFSSDAGRALDYAVELAHRFGAELVVMHVHDVIDLVPGAAAADKLRAAAQEELDRSVAALRGRDLRVRSLLREGAPSTEILRAAEAEGTDLLVVGTHGHTGLACLLLGSVAERGRLRRRGSGAHGAAPPVGQARPGHAGPILRCDSGPREPHRPGGSTAWEGSHIAPASSRASAVARRMLALKDEAR